MMQVSAQNKRFTLNKLFSFKSNFAMCGIISCILFSFSCDNSSGVFYINNDDEFTTSLDVVLTMNSSQKPAVMRFSNDNINFSAWEKFADKRSWKLDSLQGQKTVYAEFKDSANNVYKRSDSIDLVLTGIFNKLFGGTGNDYLRDIQQTKDGGYILAGFTESTGAGSGDAWLIKIDSEGNKIWDKTFGDVYFEMALTVKQTLDGGYILAGGTVGAGINGDRAWLIKTDQNGIKVWNKTLEGSMVEELHQTRDGGYVIAGSIYSAVNGTTDGWLARIDADGNKIWDKTFGGAAGQDIIHALQLTKDGGYILAGNTCLNASDPYSYEAWIIKTDVNGNQTWEKTFGGLSSAWAIHQTGDGGYILAGNIFTDSDMGDGWLMRTDSNGNKIWDKIFGGTIRNTDVINDLQITADGGYILAGSTSSFGSVYGDAWLIRTDTNGNKIWDKTFGGNEKQTEEAKAVQLTADVGFVIAGDSVSSAANSSDVWIIKTDAKGNAPGSVTPKPE